MAAMTFWLIFSVVPIITPRIKEKPVREAYKKTFAILNIVRNISPAGGEVNDRVGQGSFSVGFDLVELTRIELATS